MTERGALESRLSGIHEPRLSRGRGAAKTRLADAVGRLWTIVSALTPEPRDEEPVDARHLVTVQLHVIGQGA